MQKPLRFAGYAAIFNARDRGGDIVRAGAFARTLAARGGDVPLLWQHRRGHPVGRIERLAEDGRGLRVIARVSDEGVATMVRAGRVGGLSFGYRVRGLTVPRFRPAGRELLDVDLIEVSLVTVPMQRLARVIAVEPSPIGEGFYPARALIGLAG